MKFTKTFSVACILVLLVFGNTWAVANSSISSNWYHIGIATSQYTADSSKKALKNANAKLKTKLSCTLNNRDKFGPRNRTASRGNQFTEQVC